MNAGKHGRAQRVTVFAEPSDDGAGVTCSVHDDGRGFEPAKVKEGVGDATNDESLKRQGEADQTKSDLKQAGEKVKDAFKR